jgi:outer membrane protein TolC
VGQFAQTAAGEVQGVFSLSQRLPLPQKLDAREALAWQEARAAEQGWRQARRDAAAKVRRAYWSRYAALRALQTLQEGRGLLGQLHEAALAKLEVSQATQAGVLRLAVERDGLSEQILQQRQRADSAAALINRLIDRPAEAALPEDVPPENASTAALPLSPGKPPRDELDRAVRDHPAVVRAQAMLEAAAQRRRLARLDDWPDLTVGATYAPIRDGGLAGSANGEDQLFLSLGVNLPIWRKPRRAARREARAAAGQAGAELSQAVAEVRYRVEESALRLVSLRERLELFREALQPQAHQAWQAALSAYRAGEGDLDAVIETWRRRLTLEQTQHELVAQAHQAWADLRRALGERASEETSDKDQPTAPDERPADRPGDRAGEQSPDDAEP